jgi:hypothetical protein
MQGEGERREGEDDSEDPFKKYAEELDEKYEETKESGENRNVTRPVSAPDSVGDTRETEGSSKNAESSDSSAKREGESPGERSENREEKFEAYAKELKEKYNQEEGGTDSTQAQESGYDAAGKTSRQGEVSREQNEEASSNQMDHDAETDLAGSRASARQGGKIEDDQIESATPRSEQYRDFVNGEVDSRATSGDGQDSLAQRDQPEIIRTVPPTSDNRQTSFTPTETEAPQRDIGRYERKAVNNSGAMDNRNQPTESTQGDARQQQSEPTKIGQKPAATSAVETDSTTRLEQPKEENPSKQKPPGDGAVNFPLTDTDSVRPMVSRRELTGAEPEISGVKVAESILPRGDEKMGRQDPHYKLVEHEQGNASERPREISVVARGEWSRTKVAYLAVSKDVFEELTGTKLETGKTYDIRFKISGVGESWTRHTESVNQANNSTIRLYVAKMHSEILHVGSDYNITIDYVTEKRCLRVEDFRAGPMLRVFGDRLGTPGFGTDREKQECNPIIEIGVRNLTNPKPRMEILYATLHYESEKLGYNSAQFWVWKIANPGDALEIQYARINTVEEFAKNFNERRPKSLENVELTFREGSLGIRVDGKDDFLQNPLLKTSRLQVGLFATIGSTGRPISFWVGAETSKMEVLKRLPSDRERVRAPDSSVSYHLDRGHAFILESLKNAYTDWKQTAGFFDGDGTSGLEIRKRVIYPNFKLIDNYRPQMVMVREFLVSQGIRVHNPNTEERRGAWFIGVAQADSVRRMAAMMVPHLYKKREEVQAILDYLDNENTGTQLVEVFNESVRKGNRVGKIRDVDIPYTRREGQKLAKEERRTFLGRLRNENQKLSEEDREQIREDIISGKVGNGELAKKYGVSGATISRAVFGRSKRG